MKRFIYGLILVLLADVEGIFRGNQHSVKMLVGPFFLRDTNKVGGWHSYGMFFLLLFA